MAVERRAGAPKLIDWTGERFVPWADDVQVAYEHYHRYLWARSMTRGCRVLDLGSGEGFGSAILAEQAERVVGIDIDERSVSHSQLNYLAPNLEFRVASAFELDAFDEDSFDVVVAFEVLEHFVEQERMLAGVDRVLAAAGLLLISTPERRMYSDAAGQDNPFHERELTEPQFRALLGERFSHVALWGQRTTCGSRLGTLDAGGGERAHTVFIEKDDGGWREAGEPAAMYLVAAASRAPRELPQTDSTLVDCGIQLVRQQERTAKLARMEADVLRVERDEARAALEQLDARNRREFRELNESRRLTDRQHRAALEVLGEQVAALSVRIAERDAQLARVDGSVIWSAIQFARWQTYRLLGEHSLPSRALRRALRGASDVRARRRAARAQSEPPPVPGAIVFPHYIDPLVSIVIAAHVGADVTQACLRAIVANTPAPAYEVIVVDDCGDEDNRKLWDRVQGARIVVNPANLGYLRSVNVGAAQARGRFVVPLNNDTEVEPGWLSALVECAESAGDIGVVVPMLRYPDGSVQEAGAIVWDDATGWNYGRGQHPGAATFHYVREVDYGSGACLLVRADLWHELGGYDERYAPMYYEDADLCFAARDRGRRVVYEPAARVIHVEGASAGTDVSTGGKRHQELNRPKFAEKWREQLAQQLAFSPENVRRASDRNRGARALVVDHRVPCPDRDAGSLRMKCILECLVEFGYRVTLIPDNLADLQPYTRELQRMGIEVLYGPVDVHLEIDSLGPELSVALLSRPIIAPRYLDIVREHAPDAMVIYDTVDLHFLREERRALLGGGSPSKAASLRELELGLVRACDVTFTATEVERSIVTSLVPEARVVVIPTANEATAEVAPPAGRAGVLFVGGFDHPPNTGAVIALVRTVMPLVWRELGRVPVRIVGGQPPAEVLELAGPDVDIMGWVKDLDSLYETSRVMVAPLLYGAGMKGKVTQSLAAGLPVVTTPIGAEGLDAVDGRDMLIAADAEGLAERVVRLYRDDVLWGSLSQAGQEVAARVASPAVIRERLGELLGVADGSPVAVASRAAAG